MDVARRIEGNRLAGEGEPGLGLGPRAQPVYGPLADGKVVCYKTCAWVRRTEDGDFKTKPQPWRPRHAEIANQWWIRW